MPPDENRAYVASHFALEFGGEVLGFCRSVDGSGIKAEALTHQTGPNQDLWRYVGRVKYDDITVQVGVELSPSFYTWIEEFFGRKEDNQRNGAVVGADFNFRERTRRTFTDALISEIQFPGVDGSDKNPIYMTVKLSPEQIAYTSIPPGGPKLKQTGGTVAAGQKRWLAANFKFDIHGLEKGTKRTLKVDGFTVKQQILEYPSGPKRFATKVAGRLEYPNLTFYVPDVDVEPLLKEFRSRVEQNKPKSGKGLTGALQYLDSAKKELMTVGLEGIDIISCEPEKFESTAENIHRWKVGIHVEKMTFKKSG